MKARQKNILKAGVISVFVLPYLWQLATGEQKYDLFLLTDFEQRLRWYIFDSGHYLALAILGGLLWKDSASDWLRHSGKVIFWYTLFRLVVYWLLRFEAWLEWTSVAIIIYLMFYYVDRKYNIYSATIITLKVGWDKLRSVLRF